MIYFPDPAYLCPPRLLASSEQDCSAVYLADARECSALFSGGRPVA